MTRVERRVVGLADDAARRVELAERLGELREVAEVLHQGVPADAALEHERRPVDAREDHVIAADVHAVRRVARLHVELPRRLRDLLEHEVRVELDVLALDGLPVRAEDLERAIVVELHAELADDAPPAPIEGGHGVLGEDLVARHLVDEHAFSLLE